MKIFLFLWSVFAASILQALEPAVTLNVPMRDGLELATDIYLPSPDARNLPCILLRLPGGRNAEPWKSYAALSALGYAVAIQDTRSSIDPEGKTPPYISDGWWREQDGFDTIEWLSQSEYTNGKIGTLGFSAAGITQILLAPTAPPALKCQYIGAAPSSMYHHATFSHGQFLKNQVEGWLHLYAKDQGVLNQVCNQPFYNHFWGYLDAVKKAPLVKAPALHYVGWYDPFLEGTIEGFLAKQTEGGQGAKGAQKLIIGPWTHYYPLSMKLGSFEVPKAGYAPPFDMSPNCWFDYYLKGIPNGIDAIPAITYYVMGPFSEDSSSGNVWKSSKEWPVQSNATKFYLTEDKKLTKEVPALVKAQFSYKYDPDNPILTLGGNNLFLESGPIDQSPIEKRLDVLTFTTELLDKDTEVTGLIKAKLFMSSDCQDTDVVVRITDVYPDGKSILIADGIYRTGFYHLNDKLADVPKEIDVQVGTIAQVFAKGHRIRLSISSSNYPKYEKNLNVGMTGTNKGVSSIATNTFYVSKEYPSHLILPIVN